MDGDNPDNIWVFMALLSGLFITTVAQVVASCNRPRNFGEEPNVKTSIEDDQENLLPFPQDDEEDESSDEL